MSETLDAGLQKRLVNLANATRVKKLTIDRCVGKLGPMKEGDETRWHVDFLCYVTGQKAETSPYGEYYRWLGEFKSMNIENDEALVAANAIFPSIASDIIEAAWRAARNEAKGIEANVMCAFRVGTVYDANKAFYKYVIKDIVAPSTKSPLDRLYEEVTRPALAIEQSANKSENNGEIDQKEHTGKTKKAA